MPTNRSQTVNRLKRIEGQVRGISQMVVDDRYCIDILHQVQAVKSALASVENAILKDHAACCVADAIKSGDVTEQQEKFNELIELFGKVKR
ncbi:metal-sensitive transcriptional regulator [Sphingorhabdus sp.]|uniref:metal-sensitive transcriptional regulator n=1 Tax=Sphingorhabdus sp. TaxID=1902408 RepID=UPI003919EB83